MSVEKKIVLIDDDVNYINIFAKQVKRFLDSSKTELQTFLNPENAISYIESNWQSISVIITDFNMPKVNGVELIQKIEKKERIYQIIILTGELNRTITESFEHLNLFDILEKKEPFPKILESLKQAHLFHQNKLDKLNKVESYRKIFSRDSEKAEEKKLSLIDILGDSESMKNVRKKIALVSDNSTSCFLFGESGIGKKYIANVIHDISGRTGKFISLNCGTGTPKETEQKLFGIKEGDLNSLLEKADNGTLFLNDIHLLSIDAQNRLLRFFDPGFFAKFSARKLNIRWISSAPSSIYEQIKQRKFKEDLFYRLNIASIEVPALRERKEDIRVLTDHFLTQISASEGKSTQKIEEKVYEVFEEYYWPGNLRELQNVLQRMIIFSEKEYLTISDLPPEIQNYNKITQTEKKKTGTDLRAEMTKINEDLSMRELEREAILKALKKAENNKDLAARYLGISRASIYRKLKEYGIKN